MISRPFGAEREKEKKRKRQFKEFPSFKSLMNVVYLRDRIEALPKEYHKGIARIFIEENVSYDENKNGMFINLSTVDQTVLEKVARYISYVDLQQLTITTGETERQDLKSQFFLEPERSS